MIGRERASERARERMVVCVIFCSFSPEDSLRICCVSDNMSNSDSDSDSDTPFSFSYLFYVLRINILFTFISISTE